jgi:hypothetical protein
MHNAWSRENEKKGTRVPLAKKRIVMLMSTPSIGIVKLTFL